MADTKDTVAKPPHFTGRRTDTDKFLFGLDLYFNANAKKFAQDSTKISTALSYMSKGVAADWGQSWHKDHYQALQGGYDKNWISFRDELRKRFEPIIEKEYAMGAIQRLKATSTVDEYVEKFNTLVPKAGFDDQTNVVFFKQGLPAWCREKIMDLDDKLRPSTLKEWQTKALRYDAERKGYSYNPYSSSSYDHYEGVPMDVDSARFRTRPRLSPEERKKRRESGACFYCGAMDHFARDCPKSNQGNQGRGRYRGRGRGYSGRGSKPTYRNRQSEYNEGHEEVRMPTADEIGQAISNADELQMKEIKAVLKEVAMDTDF